MGDENERKTCPFRDQPCIEDKCVLWTQIQIGIVSTLGVVSGTKPESMCVFPALLMVMGTPRPTPQQINFGLKRQQ